MDLSTALIVIMIVQVCLQVFADMCTEHGDIMFYVCAFFSIHPELLNNKYLNIYNKNNFNIGLLII